MREVRHLENEAREIHRTRERSYVPGTPGLELAELNRSEDTRSEQRNRAEFVVTRMIDP